MNYKKIILSIVLFIVVVNSKLIMIIRHGEKINNKVSNLSDKGKARAECLIETFGVNGIYATPQKIYAQAPTKHKKSTRPRDTVIPLAKNLGLEVDLTFSSNKIKKLVKDIKDSKEDVVLISWSNELIKKIAKKFKVENVPKWDSEIFDDIWILTDGTMPYLKNSNSNIVPSAVYKGKKGVDLIIVKENVELCVNRLLNQVVLSNSN